MNLNISGFLKIIPDALVGWGSVFVVMIIIAAMIAVLNKVCK